MNLVSLTEKKDTIEEGTEGEMRGQDGIALDHAAGVENDIAGVTHETGLIPVPDPDHQLQERVAKDRQSGTNQRDFHSQWSHKFTMEKCPVSCSLGALCSWKGSEVATKVWSTFRS